MKFSQSAILLTVLSISGIAAAQSDGMQGMDMHKKSASADQKETAHKTTAVVKSANADKGTVTLAHEPVKSLNWPAMTMSFTVKDKSLFDKLASGKKVDVEFEKQGSNYIVTAVK